ncbi:MAG: sulfite exporter TauE/SafE family protein [Bacteroidota bacterium]
MMQLLGYFATTLIGVSLGFIGAGGSVLAVPVMVYLFSIQPVQATSYSLFIVGFSSGVGAVSNYRKGLVRTDVALMIGFFSIISVFITRLIILPAIPSSLGKINGHTITKSFATMILFATVMLSASVSMVRTPVLKITDGQSNFFRLALCGAAIGLIAGLSGIGGGFLIIPSLVLFAGLPMKEAVATSLLIITLNCITGIAADTGHTVFNWNFLFKMTMFAVAGIFTGIILSKKMGSLNLKKIFGWFVMLIGCCILLKEFLFNF